MWDHTGSSGKDSFFDKLAPLKSTAMQTSTHHWHPGCTLSVDEMIVMQCGDSSEMIRMRKKPIDSGIKVWSVCDSGYMFHTFSHSKTRPLEDLYCVKGYSAKFGSSGGTFS